MIKSETITKLAAALVKFNGEISRVAKDASNPFFKNKYASLDSIIDEARPVLTKNGLSILQLPSGDGEHAIMKTLLLHESGEWIESEALIIKPVKSDPQAYGSCISYMRRYSLTSFLSLNTGEDDDANISSGKQHNKVPYKAPQPAENDKAALNDKQIQRLYSIAHAAGIDHPTVLKHIEAKFNIKSTTELTKVNYDTMCKGYENMKKDVK